MDITQYIPMLVIAVICFPFLGGLITSFAKKGSAFQGASVYVSAIIEMILGLALAILFFMGGCEKQSFFVDTEVVDIIMVAGDVFLAALITVMCVKYKKGAIIPLAIIPCVFTLILDFFGPATPGEYHITVDRLAIIMVLIVTIVGGLINLYSVGYMKGYKHHHPEIKDRTNYFLPLLMVFLGAMCGLVLSESFVWMCFFWEVTSTISFLLIIYTHTEEAVTNAFRAIWMNLLGGCGLVAGTYFAVYFCGTRSMSTFLSYNPGAIQLAVALFAFGAFTKSAQFPFSSWLLGAMCAPTPSSTLLHSATMVKAGIYLLIRMSPAMAGQPAGIMVAYIGIFTFFIAAALAITVSDGKTILAYSTISNLGLMVACCGIGTAETIFGAVMLMIFHAVSKSMLFQAVGATENSLGSRDVEDFDGLILRLPKLAAIIMIGILGMYTAPFGMLISKWVALKAFVESKNIILVLIFVFGSATTMFYWCKFLSKVLTLRVKTPVEDRTKPMEYVSMFIHAFMVIAICVFIGPILKSYIEPMLTGMFGAAVVPFSQSEFNILILLLVAVFAVPLIMMWVAQDIKKRRVMSYMAGVNTGDDNSFINSFGGSNEMHMSNWYMEDVFGSQKLTKPSEWISALFIVAMIVVCLFGGVI